ncbi:hypothetical protein SLEP1_g15074 [Rubroshorea leprosula]|uniref:Transposase (putative) gypsy type domain-containing protein n=1 Tax=Rubroshorea leprosula TaxID=152421 RepID=A0AAV5IL87_9ROSI|nr:hypothetical protein SLEP1_g15074 [Rubroshorea leprosula]
MRDVVSHVSDRPMIGEWESRTITGRLENLRKAPKDLPIGFRFRAALHHEVANCMPSISGYRKLEDIVRAYHVPRTILLRTGAPNERACTVSQTGWIPVYVDHFDAGLRFPLPGLVFDLLADYELALTQLTPNSIRFIIGFMLLCAKWYYLSGRDKSQLFKNVRNKVARWKRQFIFVRDTRTERISSDLAAQLSEWRVPNAHVNYPQLLPRDTDLKNQLLDYARKENLIDLDALVTSEQLAVFGFVDVANLFTEVYWSANVSEPRAPKVAGRATPRRDKRDSTSDRQPRLNSATRPNEGPTRHLGHGLNTELRLRPRVHIDVHARRRRARKMRSLLLGVEQAGGLSPAGGSSCNRAFTQCAVNYCAGNSRACHYIGFNAFSYAVALYESEQGARIENQELGSKCKQLAAEKASLVDNVNHLQGSEMANRAAAAESRANELVNRINELKEELERAHAERENGIQAAKDEAARVEERAKRAEDERDQALNALKASHAHSVGIARAQGAEWLVGSSTFQDAVAVASANVTTEIYNEIRGKVLHHRLDFPIRELVFFDEEELDDQGKSLAPLADTTVRLRWDLNEEDVPVWPPSVLEDGEDTTGLPSFDAWVEGAPVAEQEPSSTPPNSQPTGVLASSPVRAPFSEPAARSPPARSPTAAADASMLVDLTDD